MPELNSTFNVKDFENYGSTDLYLTPDQLDTVALTESRVNSQLDWLAQLLGWNGPNYWNNLASSVTEKRSLQTGSYGIYNGFIFPEIVEVRNWDNKVVVKADPRIQAGQTFFLGDETYTLLSLSSENDLYFLDFGTFTEQFVEDINSNNQLKVLSPNALPTPFSRKSAGVSGDFSFLCQVSGTSLSLYPSFDTNFQFPVLFNTLFKGSRYFFDKPVSLQIGLDTVNPEYDFTRERWYIDVPPVTKNDTNIEETLTYGLSSLRVRLKDWTDPSDWVNSSTIQNFKGVWSNKGGKFPFHFVFDALNLHGFDDETSVYLGEFERSISFDSLLNHIYYQIASTEPDSPSPEFGRVWWNSQTGNFSVFVGDSLNCGPWVEIAYPYNPEVGPAPDYVFSDVSSFLAFPDEIPSGCLVDILDASGLNPSLGIEGLVEPLSGPCRVQIYKREDSPYWTFFLIIFDDEPSFDANATVLPEKVVIKILDSLGLTSSSGNYRVQNLGATITGQYPLLLMKDVYAGAWYISPPSYLRYIGDTRLFESSLNFANPVGGELNWDFSVPVPENRLARIFYYSNWQQDPLTSEWELTGDWVAINDENSVLPAPVTIDFGSILVYCNDTLLSPNDSYQNEDFQISYTIDSGDGLFTFKYIPISYTGVITLPVITISDSLTTVFRHDISEVVFSGLQYYMSSNVENSQKLLRVWKTEALQVTDSLSELSSLRYLNPLVADQNQGPADDNWERYFLRLPPSYQRNGAEWQKVNLVCQNFGYWGSSTNPEKMSCSQSDLVPEIYEEVLIYGKPKEQHTYLYSEPYLYSEIAYSYDASSLDFDNSDVLSGFDRPYDDFDEAEIQNYEPLHNRRAELSQPLSSPDYGNWVGMYFRSAACFDLSGFLVNDIEAGVLEAMSPPVWDASIYKFPPICGPSSSDNLEDVNHFKVGYAFFAADLSSAGEAVFDLVSAG